MTRKEGSGLANETADAVEGAIAAIIEGDDAALRRQHARLKSEYDNGWCGIPADTLVGWLKRAAAALPCMGGRATHQPSSALGDVEIVDANGELWWIEVKAQTKKPRFADITQSDWVRDGTDSLRWLYAYNEYFRALIPERISRDFARPFPDAYFRGWTFDSLVMADIALLCDPSRRQAASVASPTDLGRFMERKFLLHITREGLRLCRFTELVPVANWLAGEQLEIRLKETNAGSIVAVPVMCPGPLASRGAHFTYHVGYPAAVGRHKLHAASIADCLAEVRA